MIASWLATTLRERPELAIFATLALGHWLGNRKLGSFSLGSVTGVLLAGIAIGQLGIAISPQVKSTFFLMFLFAVGYGVGPQFFRGLKNDGLPQALFAAVQCMVSFVTAYAVARFLGYDAGAAAGLLSGSQTVSAILGVATDAINQLDIPPEQKATFLNHMPVAYAVTYIFGTAGSAWLITSLGPRLLRIDLRAECRALEATLGAREAEPGTIAAARRFDVRTHRLADARFDGTTVGALEAQFADARLAIERLRRGGDILDADAATVLRRGDVLALVGRRETLVADAPSLGPEVEDPALVDFPGEVVDVVVTAKTVAGRTIGELAASELGRVHGRGVFVRSLTRAGEALPLAPGTRLDRGDVVQIVGSKRSVARAVAAIGYADRETNATDMTTVAAGIALGALIGSITVHIGGVPLGLSTSGGALVAGLTFGWLRSVTRAFGRVPSAALWILNNLGLTTFIAVVGIGAGPSFVAGLRAAGLSLLLAGVVVSSVPLVVGILIARHVFKFHPVIALGAAAGARTTTAALAMIEAAAESKVVALGYTVPYAVGAIFLTIGGLVLVLLMS